VFFIINKLINGRYYYLNNYWCRNLSKNGKNGLDSHK